MPVGRGAPKAWDLERQHDTEVAERDFGDQHLEAEPPVSRGARAAEVLVDDRDPEITPCRPLALPLRLGDAQARGLAGDALDESS
jgi:hypothetical protein